MPGRKGLIIVAVTVLIQVMASIFAVQPAKAVPVPTVAVLENVTETSNATSNINSGTAQSNAASDVSQAIDAAGGVKPVTPAEFAGKVNKFVAGLNAAIGGLVLPIATFAMLVSICVIILGALVGHGNLKRYGWGGLLLASVGLLLFWGLPVLLGLLQALATRFAS